MAEEKKKYVVEVYSKYCYEVTVEADNEEEAKRIAFEKACDSTDEEWHFVDYLDKSEITVDLYENVFEEEDEEEGVKGYVDDDDY